MKYCVKCGHKLAEGAKFCPSCGTPVATVQPDSTESNSQHQAATATTVSESLNVDSVKESQTDSTSSEGPQSQPQLGFVGSIQYIMQHAFEFNGGVPESRKSVFWWGFLAVYLLNFVVISLPGIRELFVWLSAILLVSAAMRRLDYIGKNTGIAWLMMIPLVAIYPMILMFFDKKE
ncbi:zinc-ribbon domain-containing protein [Levilactobacillus suantsaiihabitans]|uniref:Zinc-ribbon domain-containing protein n=1 Tax=Levilactobacillus suantsaiihabitans TaxID=2487722 RepID=A0A4Z0J8B4_9LACO|nr:zinc-ribbon domain-containing protein [Levilactobacillus suantsaiihabitans]TGD17553.1 zinc-ribbon domain-containing protein [Levilactobacillus suantsaiihabitans]